MYNLSIVSCNLIHKGKLISDMQVLNLLIQFGFNVYMPFCAVQVNYQFNNTLRFRANRG